MRSWLNTVIAILSIFFIFANDLEARSDVEAGAGIGFVSGTPNGTNLSESFQVDWFVTRDRDSKAGRMSTSIGPMIQLVPPGSYTHVAGAVVTRLHWHFLDKIFDDGESNFSLVPFLGLGGAHFELKRDVGSPATNMSYYSVLGTSLDYNFLERFGASATFVHNFHDINLGNGLGHDRGSEGFFFSIRYRFGRW